MTTLTQRKLIRKVLTDFNFEKCQKVMDSLAWYWKIDNEFRLPTILEMYQFAEDLMIKAVEDKTVVSSGGFRAESDGEYVQLMFVLEDLCYNQDYV